MDKLKEWLSILGQTASLWLIYVLTGLVFVGGAYTIGMSMMNDAVNNAIARNAASSGAAASASGGSGTTLSIGDVNINTATTIAPGGTGAAQREIYRIGETWTVPGQWSLTITGVQESADRNQFYDREPAAVYIIDYTYTNLGWVDEYGLLDGLYMKLDDMVIDSTDLMGYSYPGSVTKSPKQTPVGSSCEAQDCVGVDNPGTFRVVITKYDGFGNKQAAEFIIDVSSENAEAVPE